MIHVIPMPLSVNELPGKFRLTKESGYYTDEALAGAVRFYARDFEKAFGEAPVQKQDAAVRFSVDTKLKNEAYTLHIDENGIKVHAGDKNGALYAIQTLRQLAGFDLKSGVQALDIACVRISDAPRFAWRGQSLDCARHFFPVANIKKLLDLFLLHKLNVFHWHLTDDQGWRIEIKKYPLLTEVGSKRKDTQRTGWRKQKVGYAGEPHGGYYTQDEIREVVAYAAERGIMVVPEIDMPAHFAAAEAAYPDLACRPLKTEVTYYFGAMVPHKELGYKPGDNSWNRSACLGKESTYEFIFNVLDEVCELFPAPYFHIGGDEAPRDEWKKCPHCQEKIRKEGLQSVDDLQGYFNNRVNEYIKKKGKRLIGWNEILSAGNLDRSVISQYWVPTRDKNAERYVNSGGQMILSRQTAFYFDYPNAEVTLKNAYSFTPAKSGVRPEAEKNVLGIESELWTEFIHDWRKVEFNLFPRVAAMCETAWTSESQKDFSGFVQRLDQYEKILGALHVHYAPRAYTVNPGLVKRAKYMCKFFWSNPYAELEDAEKEM